MSCEGLGAPFLADAEMSGDFRQNESNEPSCRAKSAPARNRRPTITGDFMRLIRIPLFAACLTLTLTASASVVGSVRGIIHDPQHRPVQNAMVMIKAISSDWSASTNSDANGNFSFNAVPLGEFAVTVAGLGFEQAKQKVIVMSSTHPVLHFALNVAGAKEMINVSATPEAAATDSATPTTVVDRLEIARTPGAARPNSMAMITDFVPGTYITHDQL